MSEPKPTPEDEAAARRLVDNIDCAGQLHLDEDTIASCTAQVASALARARERENEACAMLHESINVACDHERPEVPGAGAMAAVIEYRDAIRARLRSPEAAKEPERG